MNMAVVWLIVAAVLLLIELLTQSIWAVCLAIGALLAAVVAWVPLPLVWQVSVAAAGALVFGIISVPLVRKWREASQRRGARTDRTGMDALMGRRASVISPIAPGTVGRVKIDGDNWQAVAPAAHEEIPVGATVIVTGYESIILTVTPA